MAIEQMPREMTTRERPIGRVVVTGGASGLGAAAADALSAAGGSPVVVDLTESDAGYESVIVDLADTEAAHEAIRGIVAPGVDAVVTAAGIDVPGPLGEVAPDVWERVVRVNLFGTAAVVRAALPSLIERRGRIVTVASTLAHRGVSDATAYCASKFGVVGFTRALTDELKGRVGVTMLTPGGMQTSFFYGREPKYAPGPDAQLCDPRDVASAIVFALSRPDGCEVKELVVAGPTESSWP
jgi:NAD(P)-dependent dehydrogenase (short-subunit alcohol dehydrogenase family)